MIALDGTELLKHLRRPGFMAHVFEIVVEGRKERVLPREVQHDPVSGKPLHVDFLRFSATTEINVDVEVRFENEDKCARAEARRRAQHRPAHDRADLPARRHPRDA